MKTQHLTIPTPNGLCDSFVAYPQEGERFPAVFLLMDAFGPRPYLFEMATTLADRGYYVVVPNLLYRSRAAPLTSAQFPLKAADLPAVFQQLRPMIQALTSEQKQIDAAAFLDFVAKQKEVKAGKVGATGYCMGGRFAIQMAGWFPEQIAVAASFHAGYLQTEAPDSPHLLLPKIKAELYMAYAENDAGMPPAQIESFRQAVDRAGLRFESETYTGAVHGFTMADLPAYNAGALKRHWEKLIPLLARNLK